MWQARRVELMTESGILRSPGGETVSAQAAKPSATRGFEVGDAAAILRRFSNGAFGTFQLSDTAAAARRLEQTLQENKDCASDADEDCCVIAGTKGSLSMPTLRLKTYAATPVRSWFEPFEASVAAVGRRDPLKLQRAHFCAVIRGEPMPSVTEVDGLQNLRIVEAVALAAEIGAVMGNTAAMPCNH